jgi:hypothetical protein
MRITELIDTLSKVNDSDALVRVNGLDIKDMEVYKTESGNVEVLFLYFNDDELDTRNGGTENSLNDFY